MCKELRFEEVPLVLHVKELAKYLSVCRNTAYALVRSGQIRSIRVGRCYLIPREALSDFILRTT